MPSHDAGDHALQPCRLAAPELSVLTIDVVHQFPDDRQPRVGEPEPGHQRLEGAAIALVCVLGLEHVEAELAGGGARIVRRDEPEARFRVDKAADQPRAGDPVHVHAAAGHPRAAVDRAGGPGGPGGGCSGTAGGAAAGPPPGPRPPPPPAPRGAGGIERRALPPPAPPARPPSCPVALTPPSPPP